MSQDIELYSRFQDPLTAVKEFGKFICQSTLFGAEKEGAGVVIAWACFCERKSPFEILRTYHIIGGKLSKKASAALAEFRQRGGKHKWLATGEDGKKATCRFTLEGEALEVSFTIEDALRQHLVKKDSAWEKTPGNMLRARVISNGIGMLCPEIFAGGDVEDEPAYIEPTKLTLLPEPKALPAAVPALIPEPLTDATSSAPPVKVANAEGGPEAIAGAAPQPSQVQAAATPPVATSPAAQPATLSLDLEKPIEAIIDAKEKLNPGSQLKIFAWLVKRGYIPQGGNLFDISEARAKDILSRPEVWIAAATR